MRKFKLLEWYARFTWEGWNGVLSGRWSLEVRWHHCFALLFSYSSCWISNRMPKQLSPWVPGTKLPTKPTKEGLGEYTQCGLLRTVLGAGLWGLHQLSEEYPAWGKRSRSESGSQLWKTDFFKIFLNKKEVLKIRSSNWLSISSRSVPSVRCKSWIPRLPAKGGMHSGLTISHCAMIVPNFLLR